jgi:hypothetical protein
VIRQLIQRACYHDKDATKELFDRLLGKPKQSIESKTLSLTYQDFLDSLNQTGKPPHAVNG